MQRATLVTLRIYLIIYITGRLHIFVTLVTKNFITLTYINMKNNTKRKTYSQYTYKGIIIRRIDLYGRKYVCEVEKNNSITSLLAYTLSGIKILINEKNGTL